MSDNAPTPEPKYRFTKECSNCWRYNTFEIPKGTTFAGFRMSNDTDCFYCGCKL